MPLEERSLPRDVFQQRLAPTGRQSRAPSLVGHPPFRATYEIPHSVGRNEVPIQQKVQVQRQPTLHDLHIPPPIHNFRVSPFLQEWVNDVQVTDRPLDRDEEDLQDVRKDLENVVCFDSASQIGSQHHHEEREYIKDDASVTRTGTRRSGRRPRAPRSSADRPHREEDDARSIAPQSTRERSRWQPSYNEEDLEYDGGYAENPIRPNPQPTASGSHAPRSSSGRSSSHGGKAATVAGSTKSSKSSKSMAMRIASHVVRNK